MYQVYFIDPRRKEVKKEGDTTWVPGCHDGYRGIKTINEIVIETNAFLLSLPEDADVQAFNYHMDDNCGQAVRGTAFLMKLPGRS